METLRVSVEPEMIEAGVQRDAGNCAVAMALRSLSDDIGWVYVDRNTIKFSSRSEKVRYTFHAPRNVTRFIDRFELTKTGLRAFNFTLDPEDAIEAKPMQVRGPLEARPRERANPTPTRRGPAKGFTTRQPYSGPTDDL